MNIELLKILKDKSIKEALEVIENGSLKIAFVVDENNILLGSISDGDVRRAFLKGMGVDSPILDLFNNSPIVANISEFEDNLKHKNFIFSNGVDLIHEFFNIERKMNTSFLSRSVKLIGNYPFINKMFTKIADKGVLF